MLKIKVDAETIMDAEQIATGGYAPLKGFMCRADFASVLTALRLKSGEVWSLPIILGVSKNTAAAVKTGKEVLLVDENGNARARLIAEEIYVHDKSLHCRAVYGTEDLAHPGVAKVRAMGGMLIGGRLEAFLKAPPAALRKFMLTPQETKAHFKKMKWKTIAAFHTRNVVHRAHEYLQRSAMKYADGLLIHPVAGVTKSGDFKKELIIKAYQKLIDAYYPKNRVLLAALGIGMKFAGPREAVFHALVRKNYGCTHIVIGRHHAAVSGYYGTYAAHKIFSELPDLGIRPLLFKGPFYCKKCAATATEDTCRHAASERLEISGTAIRKLIKQKTRPPEWLMRPEIADLFTGLGKDAFA